MRKNITPRQRLALEKLIASGDRTEAAKAAGVSRQTVHRWMREETFRAALADAEALAVEALSRALLGLATQALATLRAAMADEGVAAGTRVKAADVTLARLVTVRELAALEMRLTELERRIQGEHETST
jgi:hypothetical protein